MKRFSALAFALGLVLAGCGGGGGSSSATSGKSSLSGGGITIKTDSQGFSTETKFVDENGRVVTKISEIKSDATGDVPPTAPQVGGKRAEVPDAPAPSL